MRLVAVDGIRLAVEVAGSGSPPVVCLSCLGGSHDEWADTIHRVQGRTTCVTYGRPGLGGSGPLPSAEAEQERGARWAAGQLRALLHAAGLVPPYVFASSSIGGFIADQYAAAWPQEVGGMVLIDPTNRSPWPSETGRAEVIDDADSGGIRFNRRSCYAELLRPAPDDVPRAVVLSSSVGRWSRNPPAVRWWDPLTLADVDRMWSQFQQDWAQQLGAVRVVASSAGHLVHREAPDLAALVIAEVVEAARDGRDVRFSPERLAEVGGYLA